MISDKCFCNQINTKVRIQNMTVVYYQELVVFIFVFAWFLENFVVLVVLCVNNYQGIISNENF